jgi:sialate O-acetylesterase
MAGPGGGIVINLIGQTGMSATPWAVSPILSPVERVAFEGNTCQNKTLSILKGGNMSSNKLLLSSVQCLVLTLGIGLSGICLGAEAIATNAQEILQMGVPFGDNAILQQKIPLPVWGNAMPNARITVSYDGQTKTAVADAKGAWRVILDPLIAVKMKSVNESPEGKTMVVTCEAGDQKVVKSLTNLLAGEVWLCSGQSNMAGKMGGTFVDQADYPALRQLVSSEPGRWLVCKPETAPGFKKVCFYFARRLQRDALVPVGVINAAVGGSRIETWLNQKPFETGGNYTKLIEPLVGFGLRGAIWYQGESNANDGQKYLPKLTSLILGWREVWNQPTSAMADGPQQDFSFYFVQLPGIGGAPSLDNPAGGDGRAAFRQAQAEALAIRNTGMSVGIDIGAEKEHPPYKLDVGERLARVALHKDYGFKDLVPSGPAYKSHRVEGSAIRIIFDYAEKGLMIATKEGSQPPKPVTDKKISWLALQAKDGSWHWAEGRIDGSELVVTSPDVKEPMAVRYAYVNQPLGNLLYNTDALPAAPFSTCGY